MNTEHIAAARMGELDLTLIADHDQDLQIDHDAAVLHHLLYCVIPHATLHAALELLAKTGVRGWVIRQEDGDK